MQLSTEQIFVAFIIFASLAVLIVSADKMTERCDDLRQIIEDSECYRVEQSGRVSRCVLYE